MIATRAIAFLLAVAPSGCATTARGLEQPWQPLFDGASLLGMEPVQFGGEGRVLARNGRLVLEPGSPLTGVTFAQSLPTCDYEIELVGARLLGSDFFCALTFPTERGCLSLVLGGWGGTVCGLSCLDGEDAAHNRTRRLRHFENGRDYRIRVRVIASAILVWIDGDEFLRIDPRPWRCTVRAELDPCQPLGLASYAVRASFAAVRWRHIEAHSSAQALTARGHSPCGCRRNCASSAHSALPAWIANCRWRTSTLGLPAT